VTYLSYYLPRDVFSLWSVSRLLLGNNNNRKTVYYLYNNGKQRYYATQQSKCFLCGLIQGYITRTAYCRCQSTAPERTKNKTPPLPSNGSSDQTNTTLAQQQVLRTDPKEKTTPLLCRCPATGVVIQFFQKCKWSRNEQNHGEGGDDSYTVCIHHTHRETDKQHNNGTFPGQRVGKHIPEATGW
jgi:hypothetical protein